MDVATDRRTHRGELPGGGPGDGRGAIASAGLRWARVLLPGLCLTASMIGPVGCSWQGPTAIISDSGSGSDDGGATPSPDGGPTADAGLPCLPPISGDGGVVIAGLTAPRRLASDARGLYVTERGHVGLGDGRVLRLPLDGGSARVVRANLEAPDAIAADGRDIWVLDANALWRFDSATLDAGVLTSPVNNADFGTTDLSLTPGDVVVASGERGLARVPKDGGTPKLLYTGAVGEQVVAARVDATTVYFLVASGTQPGLYRVGLSGAPTAVRVRPEPADGHDLRVFPDSFLWTAGDGGTGVVAQAPRDGGAVQLLATGLQAPQRPLFVDGVLYFRDGLGGATASERTLLALPACATDPVPVGPSLVGPGDVLQVGNQLYVTSQGQNDAGQVVVLP